MASPTLPVLRNPALPQVADGMLNRAIDRTAALIACPDQTLRARMTELTSKYEQRTRDLIRFESSVYAAMAYINLGEIGKAQNVLQGALLDSQLSAGKGGSNVNATA